MDVLFLDFDGVINTPVGIDENGALIDNYYSTIDRKVNNFIAVKLIEKLCKENNLKIVVSSRGWRNYLERDEEGNVIYRPYREYLRNSGMDDSLVEGHITFLYDLDKGDEIEEYLLSHDVGKFIVVDDDDNMGVDASLIRFKDNLIVCDGNRGFTEKEYKRAKEILNKDDRAIKRKIEEEEWTL